MPLVATIRSVHAEPIFADPSGRRRGLLRRLGLIVAAALVACLAAILVSMAGGPQAPFTHWAAPIATSDPSSPGHAHRHSAKDGAAQLAPASGPGGVSTSGSPAGGSSG